MLDNEAPLGAVAPWQKKFFLSYPSQFVIYCSSHLSTLGTLSDWPRFYKPGVNIFCPNLGATLNF